MSLCNIARHGIASAKTLLLTLLCATVIHVGASATPFVSISMDVTDSTGESLEDQTSYEGSAPVNATFKFTTTDADDWNMTYEWRFAHQGGSIDEPYMTRYEESPEITFSEAGTDTIVLYCTFTCDGYSDVEYKADYWREAGGLTLTASESVLTFPNAFSPNGDGINDTYKPKEHKSIVEFKATIYNRWGQKIYTWGDVSSDGWDGTKDGKDVKDGVYYVLVNARGADGRKFVIKKDVNLLRGYDTTSSSSSSSTE